jgi:hypothetical protein
MVKEINLLVQQQQTPINNKRCQLLVKVSLYQTMIRLFFPTPITW